MIKFNKNVDLTANSGLHSFHPLESLNLDIDDLPLDFYNLSLLSDTKSLWIPVAVRYLLCALVQFPDM